MNIIGKFFFFISSYIPLLIIICINAKSASFTVYSHTIDIFWVIFGVNSVLIVTSIMFLFWFLHYRRVTNRKIEIVKVENKTSETLSYILPYIVAFYQVDFSQINNILIFLIMFFTIFAVYVNSNLLAVNPILAMWGYKIFIVDTTKQKIFLISKNNISLHDKELRAKPVCCNIYIEKGVRSGF